MFRQLRQQRDSLTAHCLETEIQRLRDGSVIFEAQIHQFRGMIEVEGQTSNTLQADVLRLGAENLQRSQKIGKV